MEEKDKLEFLSDGRVVSKCSNVFTLIRKSKEYWLERMATPHYIKGPGDMRRIADFEEYLSKPDPTEIPEWEKNMYLMLYGGYFYWISDCHDIYKNHWYKDKPRPSEEMIKKYRDAQELNLRLGCIYCNDYCRHRETNAIEIPRLMEELSKPIPRN